MSATLQEFLGPTGPVARRLEGYEERGEQIEMAAAVAEALERQSHLLVEAGTGVGKSFAYLLPAIHRITQHRERVVVATNTISLQEQLIEKDIPLLNAVIPEEFSAVLVKGRGNYVSLRRLKQASERQDRLLADDGARHALHQIEDWAYTTPDGSLATLPQLDRMDVWDLARSDAHNCMGKKCPEYHRCFYQAARRRMENGDLLICNHAIYFADLALRTRGAAILPQYDHVILDEAHAVEEVAAEHFGLSLSEGRVNHLLRILYSSRHGRGFLAGLEGRVASTEVLDQTIDHVLACSNIATTFFDRVREWLHRFGGSHGTVEEPGFVKNTLTHHMKVLADRLTFLRQRVTGEPDQFELNSYAQRALDIARETELLVEQEIDDCVYWIEESGRARRHRPRITLRCAPVDVAPILQEHLFGREIGVVMTSATLAAGSDFSHIKSRLGCSRASTRILGSPFDHARQMSVFVDRTMPDPRSDQHLQSLAPRVLSQIEATNGGAFVLFTSFSALNALADRLRDDLEDLGYPLHVHGRDGPRGLLLKRFRESERSVLFGTTSFWQGVDVRGRTLRNVIITRLPFDVPDRPLIRARLKRIRDEGGNPFMDDQVPRAVIRFKQGFGRLIRSSTDRGRVVVLDPRIVTKPYGQVFLNALPEGVEVRPIDDTIDDGFG